MVSFDYAAACPRFTRENPDAERVAKRQRIGIWASPYERKRNCVER
jgi:hypothetical protein